MANGKGIARNDHEAVKYYKLAADQGDPDGQVHCGLCLEHGREIAANLEDPAKYYKLLADQANSGAEWFYAPCLKSGLGIPENAWEAFKPCKLATDQGNAHAHQYDRNLSEHGCSISGEVAMLYWLSADQGFVSARRHYDDRGGSTV